MRLEWYCCKCGRDKDGNIVKKEDQKYPATHGYCKECAKEFSKESKERK